MTVDGAIHQILVSMFGATAGYAHTAIRRMNFHPAGGSTPSNNMTKYFALSTLCLTVLASLLGGCRTVAYDTTGQNFAVFQLGEFKGLVNTTAPEAAKAVQKAVQESDLFQTYAVVNKYEAQVLARARNDQKVRINIEESNSRQTLIRIRWGEGGDFGSSRKLFDKIDSILAASGVR